jgi:curved DNA-binding protein
VTTTRDPYEVLGVSRDADADEIRRAYRALARSHHPDVSKEAGAEERFKEIGEAYAVLSDPERRAAFDRGEEAGAAAGPGPQWGPAGADDGEGFEDLFEQLFGRPAEGSVRGHAFRARGADLEAVLELDLEEVAKGGSRRLTLGDGTTVEVAIPQGITQGQRIRLAGRGAPGLGDAPPGDLFLEVRLRPHPRFTVDGRDLQVDLPVSPADAALGGRVELRTLTGTTRVSVPAGSSSGRRLRLRGQGIPSPSGPDGDLYATIRIVVPDRLSEREKELYGELREASGDAGGGR